MALATGRIKAQGFKVDKCDYFTLDCLMECWARKEGLSKEDLMDAMQQNLFKSKTSTIFCFALEQLKEGSTLFIRVASKE